MNKAGSGVRVRAASAVALALACFACGPATASDEVTEAEQLFERYLDPERHGLVRDLDLQATFAGDDGLVVYRKGAVGRGEVLLADPRTGSVDVLVEEAVLRTALSAAGAPAGLPRIVRYQPARRVLYVSLPGPGSTQWAYDLATGVASRHEQSPSAAVASPDGSRRLFVRDYDLWLGEDRDGGEVRITNDGGYDRRYASNYPRFGQQVESDTALPPMRVEAEWSPDGRYVLTYRLDRNGATIHRGVQAHPPDGGPARVFEHVYPNAGATPLPLLQPIVVDVATLQVRELDVPAQVLVFPRSPPLSWQGGRILYQWTARGYGEVVLFEVDPASGTAEVRAREALEPAVMPHLARLLPAPELGGTLVLSERSGWAQLYLVEAGADADGGRRLTSGDWEINAVLHVARDGILVTGKGREPGAHPYYEHLYRVGLDGSLARLTPEPLDHKVELSKDGQWFIDRMSSPVIPTRTLLRSAIDGRIAMELGEADPWPLLAGGYTVPELFEGRAADGKTPLYGLIYRPPGFDPSRRYPVIEHVYTGPHRHRIREDYARSVGGTPSALTTLGAIVVLIDAPGTMGRGRDFRMASWRNLHGVGVDDHVGMLRQMQARYPYMDIDRGVGIIGGSAGGYDVVRFMVRRPDIYTVGVSSSGNHQLRMAKVWWPEIHMGLADEATWEANENATYADRLQGRLLLAHGDIDDNVPIRTTLTLSRALEAAGKPHELLVLPNVGHSVATPEFHRATREFFMRELIEPERG